MESKKGSAPTGATSATGASGRRQGKGQDLKRTYVSIPSKWKEVFEKTAKPDSLSLWLVMAGIEKVRRQRKKKGMRPEDYL